jgi:insertion element IS1 protein InsB
MPDATPPRPPIPPCPRCGSAHVVRNGLTHSGTPGFRCRACDRRFVAAPKTGPVPEATKDLIRRLLAERLGIRAIARAVGVSRSWLQGFVNTLYREDTPHDPGPPPKSPDPW